MLLLLKKHIYTSIKKYFKKNDDILEKNKNKNKK